VYKSSATWSLSVEVLDEEEDEGQLTTNDLFDRCYSEPGKHHAVAHLAEDMSYSSIPGNEHESARTEGVQTTDSLWNDPELQIEKPPMWFQDTTAQIFNALVKDNVDQKCEEMKAVLQPEYQPWLAYYLVKNRASKEVNFHPIYIEFFEKFKEPRLLEMVTNVTYDCLCVLLKSVDHAVVSTSHRTVLKNLGYWLGQITLARNKPLKSKQMDLKSLLLDAFENGRLIAVLPLVCKILEGVHKSKVYKPSNPWTTAIMSLLAEIHDVPNLRTNLMFEVEVLCKHLDIKISELKRSELLVGKKVPSGSNDVSALFQHDLHHDPASSWSFFACDVVKDCTSPKLAGEEMSSFVDTIYDEPDFSSLVHTICDEPMVTVHNDSWKGSEELPVASTCGQGVWGFTDICASNRGANSVSATDAVATRAQTGFDVCDTPRLFGSQPWDAETQANKYEVLFNDEQHIPGKNHAELETQKWTCLSGDELLVPTPGSRPKFDNISEGSSYPPCAKYTGVDPPTSGGYESPLAHKGSIEQCLDAESLCSCSGVELRSSIDAEIQRTEAQLHRLRLCAQVLSGKPVL
jgi:hypothetical protein